MIVTATSDVDEVEDAADVEDAAETNVDDVEDAVTPAVALDQRTRSGGVRTKSQAGRRVSKRPRNGIKRYSN